MTVFSKRFWFAFAMVGAVNIEVYAAPLKLTLVKHDQDRRFILVEKQVPAARLTAPFKLTDDAGKSIPCQWEAGGDGQLVRFVVQDVPAGQAPTFTLDHSDSGPSEKAGITIKELG